MSVPYFQTPPRSPSAGRLPAAYQLVPEALDHKHRLDTYLTADDHEVVYCTICGGEW